MEEPPATSAGPRWKVDLHLRLIAFAVIAAGAAAGWIVGGDAGASIQVVALLAAIGGLLALRARGRNT